MVAMHNTRKGGLNWFLSCVCVVGFPVATNIVPLAAGTVQTVPPGYTRDNSDWWSLTRTFGTDDEVISQEGDLQNHISRFSDLSSTMKHSVRLRLN